MLAGITGLLRDEHRLMGLLDADREQGAKRISRCLGDAVQLANRIDEANTSGRIALLNRLVQGIRVSPQRLAIEIKVSRLLESGADSSSDALVDPSEVTVSVEVPIEPKRVAMAVRMIVRAAGSPSGRIDHKLLAWCPRRMTGLPG